MVNLDNMVKSYKSNDKVYILNECVTDEYDLSLDIINENTEVSPITNKPIKTITAKTTLQSFDVENWNRRIYSGDLVMDSIDNDGMIQNDIKKGQWIGEFGHPLDTSPKRQMIMFPQTSSHRILNYWREGNLLKATVQTLPYGYGLAMAANAMNGVPWAFSLRSLGSVDLQTRRVKAPLKVITYDSVYRPSHIEAYGNDILTESAGYEDPYDNLFKIMDECSMVEELPDSFVLSEVTDFVKERSENLQIIADMFNLDKFECTLNESGTRINVKSDNTTFNIPIETAIRMQYSNILNSIK